MRQLIIVTNESLSQQSELWESAWRAEVCCNEAPMLLRSHAQQSSTGESVSELYWKQLNDWEACYRRTPRESKDFSNHERNDLMQELNRGVLEKLMDVFLEVVASMIGTAEASMLRYVEESLTATTSESMSLSSWLEKNVYNSKAALDKETVGSQNVASKESPSSDYALVASATIHILNCLSAAVLTFRFERLDPAKFCFFRGKASGQVADYIWRAFDAVEADEESGVAAERLFETRRQVNDLVNANKAATKELVVRLLDERVTKAADEALDGALAATEEMLDDVEHKLEANENGKVSKAGTDGTVKIRQAIEAKGSETKKTLTDKDAFSEKVVTRLSEIINGLVLRQMDGLILSIVRGVDALLSKILVLREKRQSGMTQQMLRNETLMDMEEMYANLEQSVKAGAETAVKIITFGMSMPQLLALVSKLQ